MARKEQVYTVSAAMIGKGNYSHFMEKEIHDQPEAIAHTLHAVIDPATGGMTLPAPLFRQIAQFPKRAYPRCS